MGRGSQGWLPWHTMAQNRHTSARHPGSWVILVLAALAMGPPGCFGPGLEPPGDVTPVGAAAGAAAGAGARQQVPDAVVAQPPAVVGGAGVMQPVAGQNANGEADVGPDPNVITDGGMPDAAVDGGDDDEDAGSSSA